jgi:hypothetical protein
MKRRKFITLLGGAAAWPLAARAQRAGRMRRIANLIPYAKGDAEYEGRIRDFRQELERLGWIEGINAQFDERWTTDNMDVVGANSKPRGMESGCHRRHRRSGRSDSNAIDPLYSDHHPHSFRSGRDGLGEKPCAAGRQCHRLYSLELSIVGKMLEDFEAGRARHCARWTDI